MSRKGREFELLIKTLEGINYPDARIESPYFISDPDTGEQREIDVAVIIMTEESKQFIIDIECRNRKSTESVKWIEELIGRRKRLGIDLVIAVTRSNFTRPAIIAAEREGVLLRKINEINNTINIVAESIIVEVISYDLVHTDANIRTKSLASFNTLPPLLYRDNNSVNINELAQDALRQSGFHDILSQNNPNGDITHFYPYSLENLYVKNGKSKISVDCIEFVFGLRVYNEKLILYRKTDNLELLPGEENCKSSLEEYTFGEKVVAKILYNKQNNGLFSIDVTEHFYAGTLLGIIRVKTINRRSRITGIQITDSKTFIPGTTFQIYGK